MSVKIEAILHYNYKSFKYNETKSYDLISAK